ncbi:MAG: nucleoside deaminase [Sphingobacteriales bacterium]|nr:MAG: nucleoside deaminase [Sphingobacteriales bacterium]
MKHFPHEAYIARAVELSAENMQQGNGGPFGAVIVRNGEIIAEGTNCVTTCMDPTAHAEVTAIREACKKLNDFSLEGCILYASCEPCPMCLSAIYWARIDAVYFAATRYDAAYAGFDDDFLYRELHQPIEKRTLPIQQIQNQQATEILKNWRHKTDKVAY